MCCISPSKDALNLMKQGVLDAAHKRTPAIQMLQKWSCTLIMVLEWPGVVWLKNKHSGRLREVATGPSAYHATCSKFSWRKSTLHISQSHPNPTLRIELTLTCEIPLWVQQCKSTCVVSTGLRLDGKNNSTWLGFSFSLSSSKNKKIHLFPITTGRQSSTTSISMKPRLRGGRMATNGHKRNLPASGPHIICTQSLGFFFFFLLVLNIRKQPTEFNF